MKGKITNIFSAIFAVLALTIGALAVYLCFARVDAAPVLLTPAENAQGQAVRFLDAVCRGDYSAGEELLLGTPALGVDHSATEDVSVLVWDAFVDSLSYALLGECYATDSGVAQDVVLTYLDIDATMVRLRQRSQAILAQLQYSAEDISDLYDRDNNYREDVVMQVVYTAAQESLEEDAKSLTTTLTLNMVYLEDQWWIVPDDALIRAISGGMAG